MKSNLIDLYIRLYALYMEMGGEHPLLTIAVTVYLIITPLLLGVGLMKPRPWLRS